MSRDQLLQKAYYEHCLYSFTLESLWTFITREKAEKEAAERAKQQQAEESDDGVVVSKVKIYVSTIG